MQHKRPIHSFDQRQSKAMQGIQNHSILFPDIETSGLPKKESNWQTDFATFPFVVSIAFKFRDIEKHYILNQEGRTIPDDVVKVHGITTEIANQSPHYFSVVMGEFLAYCKQAERIVGQNLYFDTSIIKANVLRQFGVNSFEARIAIEALDKSKRIDLIRVAQKHFKCGYLKLSELYDRLFPGETFKGHDALEDVRAVERCYLEFIKLGAVK